MASGTMNLTFSNQAYMAGRLEWTATAGTSSQNYSTVTVKVYAWRTNTGYTTERTPRIDFTINGTTYSVDATSSSIFTYNSNTLCATKTVTVNHNSDGTKTCAIGLASTSSLWHSSSTTYYFNAVSQNVTFDKIARYTSFTSAKCTATTLDTATFSWSAANTCNYVRYYFNSTSTVTNVGTISASSGSFTKTGLTPNKTYYLYIEVRRADSNLWTKSGKITFTTKAKTTLKSISDTTPTIGRNLTYSLSNPSGTTSNIRVYVKNSAGGWNSAYYLSSAPNSGTLNLSSVKAAMYDDAINMASTQYRVRVYCGGTAYYNDYTYNVNMPASTVSITNAYIGKAATISVNRDDANLTHNITYVFGSGSGTVATGVTTSNSWTTPTSLASKIPNAKSGTCTITCKTYHGSAYVGSKTATCTLTIPSTTFSKASCTSTSLNTAAFSWTAADTCDYVRYYFNGSSTATNVGATSAKTGTFTKTGLTPNKTYYLHIEVKRADSQWWTKSGKISFTTKAKTTLASISDTTPTIGRNLTYTLSNPSATTSRIRVYVKDSGGSWGTQVYDYNSAPNSGTLSLSGVKATMYDRAINRASTQYLIRVYCGSDAYYTDYTYNVNMPASTVSITNANIGSAATVSVGRDDANLTHNITYVFGSGSGTVATGVTTSKSWTTPTSLASKISNAKSGTCTITCKTYHGSAYVGSKTATCTLTIPKSSVSLSASSADMGVSRTLTIGRIYTNLTHKITYSFNGATGTIASAATTSSSWTFPVATLAPKIPNATSGTGTITCTTKNGTATVGTSSISFTAKVPTSVAPSFTSFTSTELNSAVTTALGVSAARTTNYVKSLSNMRLAINGAAGAYGSTISSYRITFDGNNQNSATTKTRDVPINWSGNKTVSCRITDSRGRTASSGNITISALNYVKPTLNTFTINRCNSSGTLDQMGTYARVNINIGASSLLVNSVEKNTITAKLYSKPKSSSTYVLKKTLTGTTSIVSNTYDLSGYLQTTSYDFQLVINDVFNSLTKIYTLSSSSVVMSWGENGVGIGKIHEEGALDVAGNVTVNNGSIYLATNPQYIWGKDTSNNWRLIGGVTNTNDVRLGDTGLPTLICSNGGLNHFNGTTVEKIIDSRTATQTIGGQLNVKALSAEEVNIAGNFIKKLFIGSGTIPGDDLNNLYGADATGHYPKYTASTIANCPMTAGIIIVFSRRNGMTVQIAVATSAMYYRYRTTTTWGTWRLISSTAV